MTKEKGIAKHDPLPEVLATPEHVIQAAVGIAVAIGVFALFAESMNKVTGRTPYQRSWVEDHECLVGMAVLLLLPFIIAVIIHLSK